jgi:hypothetical protein
MSPALNHVRSTSKNLLKSVMNRYVICFELLSPWRTLIIGTFQNIVKYLVIFTVKVLVVGHARKHTIWVSGLIKWHFGTIRVIPPRREVARSELYCIEMAELAQSKRFHSTFGHLAHEHLMQALKCVDTCLKLFTVKTR